ncbi:hypothetical protein FQN49_001288 [Arthroderma sp. PD_2]|nr:hypothetical protein FQN49_001288 [Arthroderma sp. PD_2]
MTFTQAVMPGRNNLLLLLPLELLLSISSYLSNRDLKNLRLTCASLRDRVLLRLDRVFLSPNGRNIEVFRAIASHETYRRRVVEIIWDEARLIDWPPKNARSSNASLMASQTGVWYAHIACNCEDCACNTPEGCPAWFTHICRENIADLIRRIPYSVKQQNHIAKAEQVAADLPLRQSWIYYKGLLETQKVALRSGADIKAFKFGLKQFPALKKITTTSAAHGWLFSPLYETPMIRDFPRGFNYPIPRGLPFSYHQDIPLKPGARSFKAEKIRKDQWRGFQTATRLLALGQDHHVSELVVDVNQLRNGLSYHIFNEPCREYDNLTTLLRRPGFSRLDLAVFVGKQTSENWSSSRLSRLHEALACAPELQHFSICTDQRNSYHDSKGPISALTPLQTIFPVDRWRRLQHFGLSGFPVSQDNLLALLAALPPTLRSIEFGFLVFLKKGESHRTLLEQMRDTLGWRDRAVEERPRVSIMLKRYASIEGRSTWVGESVAEFLYGDGENPFSGNQDDIKDGMGVDRDSIHFDPVYERS